MKTFIYRVFVIGSLVLLQACNSSAGGSGDGAPAKATAPEVEITIDTGMTEADPLPPIDPAGAPRPVAQLVSPKGTIARFAQNELTVVTDSRAQLDTFLSKWQGVVLRTTNPADFGITGLPVRYLVRVNTDLVVGNSLGRDVYQLGGRDFGHHKISSDAARKLLTIAAEARKAGMKITPNWVSEPQSFLDNSSLEATNFLDNSVLPFMIDGKTTYSNNVFNWRYMTSPDGREGFKVVEAWQLLERAEKLDNKVKIAVIDGGFVPNDDLSVDSYFKTVTGDPIQTRNPTRCSGGNRCDWHGHHVMMAALAMPDNGIGTAGPGGPVADGIMIHTSLDDSAKENALFIASLEGAKIINMSFGGSIPALGTIFYDSVEEILDRLNANGILLITSAGNDGINVDAEDCFVLGCWEEEYIFPCETDSVMCVGGLGLDYFRHRSSNTGPSVEIYGPFSVLTWKDPDNPEDSVRPMSGTSFSSPFVSGVAALMWAANPNLANNDIRRLLRETAGYNYGLYDRGRYVNAYEAVHAALGTSIILDDNLTRRVQHGNPARFRAEVINAEDHGGSYEFVWQVRGSGLVLARSEIANPTITLPLGIHTIVAKARFADGFVARKAFELEVVASIPTGEILNPIEGITVYQGQSVNFTVDTYWSLALDNDYEVPDNQVVWYYQETNLSANRGDFGIGRTVTTTINWPAGEYLVYVFETTRGFRNEMDAILITVAPAPVDLPPTVNILRPALNTIVDLTSDDLSRGYIDMAVEWEVTDTEDLFIPLANLQWTGNNGGATPINLPLYYVSRPKGSPLPGYYYLRLNISSWSCDSNYYYLDLTATDSAGNSATDRVRLVYSKLC